MELVYIVCILHCIESSLLFVIKCDIVLHLFRYTESDGLLAHESTVVVPSHQLNPAQKLQWNISAETAKDIETAKVNLDK